MMDLTCWGVHFTLWEWFRSCALLAFIQPEISIKIQGRTGDLCGFRMYVWALPPTLLCWWMYSTYIRQSVSLLLPIREFLKYTWTWSATVLFISACELQAEQLLVIEFRGWVVVKRSFRSQEMVSHLRITASFDVYDSGNVTKRPCWRCWRLAVWGCMYATCPSPFKVTILRYLQASSSLVSHR